MTPRPGSLDAVNAAPAGLDRYRAALEYITRAEHAARAGRAIRDRELRALCRAHGPVRVARMTGASLGTVKAANIPANDP